MSASNPDREELSRISSPMFKCPKCNFVEEHFDDGKKFIAQYNIVKEKVTMWVCPECGEEIDPNKKDNPF